MYLEFSVFPLIMPPQASTTQSRECRVSVYRSSKRPSLNYVRVIHRDHAWYSINWVEWSYVETCPSQCRVDGSSVFTRVGPEGKFTRRARLSRGRGFCNGSIGDRINGMKWSRVQ